MRLPKRKNSKTTRKTSTKTCKALLNDSLKRKFDSCSKQVASDILRTSVTASLYIACIFCAYLWIRAYKIVYFVLCSLVFTYIRIYVHMCSDPLVILFVCKGLLFVISLVLVKCDLVHAINGIDITSCTVGVCVCIVSFFLGKPSADRRPHLQKKSGFAHSFTEPFLSDSDKSEVLVRY